MPCWKASQASVTTLEGALDLAKLLLVHESGRASLPVKHAHSQLHSMIHSCLHLCQVSCCGGMFMHELAKHWAK